MATKSMLSVSILLLMSGVIFDLKGRVASSNIPTATPQTHDQEQARETLRALAPSRRKIEYQKRLERKKKLDEEQLKVEKSFQISIDEKFIEYRFDFAYLFVGCNGEGWFYIESRPDSPALHFNHHLEPQYIEQLKGFILDGAGNKEMTINPDFTAKLINFDFNIDQKILLCQCLNAFKKLGTTVGDEENHGVDVSPEEFNQAFEEFVQRGKLMPEDRQIQQHQRASSSSGPLHGNK